MTTDLTDLEQQTALDHLRELMSAHWREAQDAQDDDGKFGIGFKVSFDRSASPTKLKVLPHLEDVHRRTERSEIAKGRSLCPQGSAGGRWQIESEVEDPQQPKLL